MPANTTTTTVGMPGIAQIGPPGQPYALERRAFAEGARTAAMLARLDEHTLPSIEARDDPAAGLEFVLTIGSATIVALLPDHRDIQARWLDENSLPAVAAWAVERSNAGFNLYFTPNLPAAGLARKPAKADMVAVRAVFADVDAKAGRGLGEALAAIAALPLPPPSLIIASGGGFQPVWVLNTPVPATPDAIAAAEGLGRRLAGLAGGDPVQNVDRVLRLPFTTNYPNIRKRDAGRRVSLSGLVRGAIR